MIDGITVLNQFVPESDNCRYMAAIIFVVAAFIVTVVLAILVIHDGNYILTAAAPIAVAVICVAAIIAIVVEMSNAKQDITHYQVLISDDVSFTEFNERYEIIKQDGDIFTITEKEVK